MAWKQEFIPVNSSDKFVEWAKGREVYMVRTGTGSFDEEVDDDGKKVYRHVPAIRADYRFSVDVSDDLTRTWMASEVARVRGDGKIMFGPDAIFTKLENVGVKVTVVSRGF